MASIGCNAQSEKQKGMNKTQVLIKVDRVSFSAELYDNPTANSLLEQMPFAVELKDYAATEKIFYPKEKLSLDSSSKGYDPKKGDVTCYGPWGNVAIFYKDHGYADGLILLGHIEDIDGLVKAIEKTNAKVEFEIKD